MFSLTRSVSLLPILYFLKNLTSIVFANIFKVSILTEMEFAQQVLNNFYILH